MNAAWMTIAAVALYGALHSALASHTAKDLVRTRLGASATRAYRLLFNILAGVTLLPVMAVVAFNPGSALYRVAWPWAGVLLLGQATAVVLLLLGLRQTDVWHFLGLRQLGAGSRASRLVVSGLYQWVRHPLYTAGLILLWLTPIMTSSLLAFNVGMTIYIWVGSRFEERRLEREFGQAYRDYRQHVPALIPLPRPRVTSTRR
jgi:protein-S-isoprenylcysteine O-methyltransferase Ste14